MSRGSKFQVHNEEAHEDWLLSYADMITLLMAFFVMMASVSKVDMAMYEQISSSMAQGVGNRKTDKPIETIKKELKEVVGAYDTQNGADVGTDDRGVVLNLDGGTVFLPGSSDLRAEIQPLLKEMAATLANPRFADYRIEVQGHTDDTPIRTAQFPTNFDLSAARALSVMRAFMGYGVRAEQLTVSAFGPNAPRVPNHLDDGTPLPQNQALNRRVAVRIYPR